MEPGQRAWVGGSITAAAATIATATAAAATVAATAAAATVTTATAVAAATRARLAGSGFVDGESPAVMFLVVERPDRFLRLGIGVHLDKPEAFAATGFTVGNHLSALHGPELGKELLELGVVDPVGQIADVQFLAQLAIS